MGEAILPEKRKSCLNNRERVGGRVASASTDVVGSGYAFRYEVVP